jgi:hypothetical protein
LDQIEALEQQADTAADRAEAAPGELPAEPADEAPEVQQAPTAKEPRDRQSAAPLCPYHQQRCRAGRSSAFFTYYYCQVPGCSYSEKKTRPQMARRVDEADEDEGFSAR